VSEEKQQEVSLSPTTEAASVQEEAVVEPEVEYAVGQEVQAAYGELETGRERLYYFGTITKKTEDGKYEVHFDEDGSKLVMSAVLIKERMKSRRRERISYAPSNPPSAKKNKTKKKVAGGFDCPCVDEVNLQGMGGACCLS
jgi:hypothetical protein